MVVLKQESEYATIEGDTFSRVSSFFPPNYFCMFTCLVSCTLPKALFISGEIPNGARLARSAKISYFQPV